MNNFRQHHTKPFGNRRSDLPNPWMTEEELTNIRRQNPLYHSIRPNLAPNMHPPLLAHDNMLSPLNNFMIQNTSELLSPSFKGTRFPNPDIFKSAHSVNVSNYPNHFMGDRFPNNSYSRTNLQHNTNGPLFKDVPSSNLISPQLHKNDQFSESGIKLFPNMRQSQERFSGTSKDQSQFHRNYNNSEMSKGKDFPVCNKELQSQNHVSFNDKTPTSAGSNFSSYKPNYRAPSLFPAYSPKDNSENLFQKSKSVEEETPKSVHQSAYNSDFSGKSNTFCDKTPLSSKHSKALEPFQEKTEFYPQRAISVTEALPQHSNSSYLYDKPSFSTMSNSPVPEDSFKTLENIVTASDSKFPSSTENQLACFQSASEATFQRSQSMQISDHPSTTASSDYSMQNQQACFQSSSKATFQRSQNMQMSDCPSTTATSDYSMQNQQACFQSTSKATFQKSQSMQISDHLSTTASGDYSMQNQQACFQSSNKATFQRSQSMQMSDHPSTTASDDYCLQNQQACFQSPSETTFQTSQSMQISDHPNTTASSDYSVQNIPFSSGAGTSLHHMSTNASTPSQFDSHQSSKETFSSFNFENQINSKDIADLLPGIDAFLKETLSNSEENKPEGILNKSEEDVSKDNSNISVSNCTFSDDDWSRHSIPFIGENQNSGNNSMQNDIRKSYCDQAVERFMFEPESEISSELKLPDTIHPVSSTSVKVNKQKDVACEKEATKVTSALEEAIELLVTSDAIVGLDYIIEHKKNINQQGSFPFRCKLCNSAISRPSIIDHIIGSKHRMRYLKVKNESKYEYIISLKVDKSEKDSKIAEAAFQMELMYGRGHVFVDTEEFQKDTNVENKSKETDGGIEEPVYTLEKIPVTLSPQHDEMDSSLFPFGSDLKSVKQELNIPVQKEAVNELTSMEVRKKVSNDLNSVSVLPGLGSESSSCFTGSDSNSALQFNKPSNDSPKNCSSVTESDMKILENNSATCQVKRSLSPTPSYQAKILKTEPIDESEKSADILIDQEASKKKTEPTSQERKEFSLDIFEELSKSVISTEGEASVVLKVINMLMEKFLRYKLQHLSLEKVEVYILVCIFQGLV